MTSDFLSYICLLFIFNMTSSFTLYFCNFQYKELDQIESESFGRFYESELFGRFYDWIWN